MHSILEAIFSWEVVGSGVGLLAGAAFGLAADEFKKFRAAQICFTIAAVLLWGKALVWAAFSSNTVATRIVVAIAVVCGVLALLAAALWLINRREREISVPAAAAHFQHQHFQHQPQPSLDSTPAQPQNRPTTRTNSIPTPEDIAIQIKSLPPFQQAAARSAYVGLEVSWFVRFASLYELPSWSVKAADETHIASFSFGQNLLLGVRAALNIDRFPRLKISHRNTPFRISGIIESVEDTDIELKEVIIEFLPDDQPKVSAAQ